MSIQRPWKITYWKALKMFWKLQSGWQDYAQALLKLYKGMFSNRNKPWRTNLTCPLFNSQFNKSQVHLCSCGEICAVPELANRERWALLKIHTSQNPRKSQYEGSLKQCGFYPDHRTMDQLFTPAQLHEELWEYTNLVSGLCIWKRLINIFGEVMEEYGVSGLLLCVMQFLWIRY